MKKTILIIEDDFKLRENVKTLLEEEGFKVITANDGSEGVNIATERKPDLIICDILMPNMDGYTVLQTLSQNKETAFIPFIFLTAKSDLKDFRKGMEYGADDYIFKPFTSDILLKAIEARLKKNEVVKVKIVDETKELENENKRLKKLNENEKIFLVINNIPQFISVKSVKFIRAEDQYTNINLDDGRNLLIRKSLSHWESVLPDNLFIRIHRSTIINLDFLVKAEKWFKNTYKVFLKDIEEPFIISRRTASKLRYRF